MSVGTMIDGSAILLTVKVPIWSRWLKGVDGAVRFLVVGTIGKEERPPQGQLWMEQYLISLKYWPI